MNRDKAHSTEAQANKAQPLHGLKPVGLGCKASNANRSGRWLRIDLGFLYLHDFVTDPGEILRPGLNL